jgi:hypothetical protein
MGIEFFLILVVVVLAGGALFFFSGAFGLGKAARERRPSGPDNPTHTYVENKTAARSPHAEDTDAIREQAEKDPNTDVR